MSYRRSTHTNQIAPLEKSGHLYYARLVTDFGPLYKLGFTTHESVYDRLAYKNTGDEALLDETLLFIHLEDAYDVEQKLHNNFSSYRAFSKFSAVDFMPLYLNGQSELYFDDILQLDRNFDAQAAKDAKLAVKKKFAQERSSNRFVVWYEVYGLDMAVRALTVITFPLVYPILELARWLDKEGTASFDRAADEVKKERSALLQLISERMEAAKQEDVEVALHLARFERILELRRLRGVL